MKTKKHILVVDHLPARVEFFIERFGKHILDIVDNDSDLLWNLEFEVYDYIFLGGSFPDSGGGVTAARYLSKNTSNSNNNAVIVLHSHDLLQVDEIITLLPDILYFPYSENRLVSLFSDL